MSDEFLKTWRRVVIVACGTSYHAGLVGRCGDRIGGRGSLWRWTSRRSSATATRCRRARPRDRHLAVRRDGGHPCGHAACARARRNGAGHPNIQAARQRATRTGCSSRAPALRSAWPRLRRFDHTVRGHLPVRPEARAATREARAGRDRRPLLELRANAAMRSPRWWKILDERDQGDHRALEGRGLLPLPGPPCGPVHLP